MPSIHNPGRNGNDQQAANRNGSVVERRVCNRVLDGQREEDRDCSHPNNCHPTDEDSIAAQVERSWHKGPPCQSHPKKYGQGICNVQTNGCYRNHSVKGHCASKRLQKVTRSKCIFLLHMKCSVFSMWQ